MSLEDLGFKRLISRPSSLVGAVSASPSGWVWGGLGAALAGVLGAAVYYRKTTPEYEATLDKAAEILKIPRAVLDTTSDPRVLRLAKKGVSPEAIVYGVAMTQLFPHSPNPEIAVVMMDRVLEGIPEKHRHRLMAANAASGNFGMADTELSLLGWDPRDPLAPNYPDLHAMDAARVAALGLDPQKIYEPADAEKMRQFRSSRVYLGHNQSEVPKRGSVYRESVIYADEPASYRYGEDDPDPRVRVVRLKNPRLPSAGAIQQAAIGDVRPLEEEWKKLSDDERRAIVYSKHGIFVGTLSPNSDAEYGIESGVFRTPSDALDAAIALGKSPDEAEKRDNFDFVRSVFDAERETRETNRKNRLPAVPDARWSQSLAKWYANIYKSPERLKALMAPRTFSDQGDRYVSNYLVELEKRVVPDEAVADPSRSLSAVFDDSRLPSDHDALLKYGDKPLHRPPVWWENVSSIPGVRLLNRAPEFLAEGKELEHCLGDADHLESAAKGQCVYLSITGDDGKRATMEIDPRSLSVYQFYGAHNSSPPQSAVRVWADMVAKLRSRG